MADSDNKSATGVQEGWLRALQNVQPGPRRPILTHLNADTTWLLSIPYPDEVSRPANRCRFNVLIDPWLQGAQVDGAGWFSTQWHAIRSSVQHVSEVESLLQQAETLELPTLKDSHPQSSTAGETVTTSYIDAVVISHEFTDHCHQSTLLEVHCDVPVFATTKAAQLIDSWKHFATVIDMAPFTDGVDWRTTATSPLPSWLGVSRLVTPNDSLYYHSAILVCIGQADGHAETVIYTPHGVETASLDLLAHADPPVTTVALLHGLHDVSLRFTKQLNLGAFNALKAQRMIHAKYWIGTHDEVKKGGGIVARILRRKAHTLQDALQNEARSLSAEQAAEAEELQASAAFVDLDNGQSLLLQ